MNAWEKTIFFGAGLKRNVQMEPVMNHKKVNTHSKCTQTQTKNKMEQKKKQALKTNNMGWGSGRERSKKK